MRSANWIHVPQRPRGARKLQEDFVVVSNGGSARTFGGSRACGQARGHIFARGNGIKAVRKLRGSKDPSWGCSGAVLKM